MTPCNKTCKIGPDGYCIGCKRTLQEIAQWHYMNDTDRATVMEALRYRGYDEIYHRPEDIFNEQDG